MKRLTLNGFTLVEMLLYMTIVSTVLLAASGFVASMLATNVKNGVIAEVEQQANQVLSLIEEVGQGAITVTAPAIGTSGSSLTFTTPVSSPVVFTQTAGVITISEGGGAAVALTNSRVTASGFSVSNLSAIGTSGTVRVQFTMSFINSGGHNEYNYTNSYLTSVTSRF